MLSYFISLLASPFWRVERGGNVSLWRFFDAISAQHFKGVIILERPFKKDAIHEVLQGLSNVECMWRLKCLAVGSCLYVVEIDVQNLATLSNLARECASPEVCTDLCVIDERLQVNVLWYDVDDGGLAINGSLDESVIHEMACAMQCSYTRVG